MTVDYAFQDINDIPGILPEGRTKPWGTGQAVLAAKNVIDLLGKIIANILTALYEAVGFSLLLSYLAMFFYLYSGVAGGK